MTSYADFSSVSTLVCAWHYLSSMLQIHKQIKLKREKNHLPHYNILCVKWNEWYGNPTIKGLFSEVGNPILCTIVAMFLYMENYFKI